MFVPNRHRQMPNQRFKHSWSSLALLLISPLLVVSSLPGCSGATDLTAEQHIERAKDQHDKGEGQAAIIELKNALRQAPNNVEARWLLGSIYLEIGAAQAAEKELRHAVDFGLDPDTVVIPLTKAALLQGKFQDIVDNPIAPQHLPEAEQATLWALRGHAQLALRNLDSAEEMFDTAISINENEPEAGLGKARLAAARNRIDQARERLGKVLETHPDFAPKFEAEPRFDGGTNR